MMKSITEKRYFELSSLTFFKIQFPSFLAVRRNIDISKETVKVFPG